MQYDWMNEYLIFHLTEIEKMTSLFN